YIARHPRITALDISKSISITERATRKIIADLSEEGYIEKKREGRRVRYRINYELPLRHPSHGESIIGDLLKSIKKKNVTARQIKEA
ncbi:MAG: winged helix-turn-helix transcriptional regulator, partial [Dehalococcoidia bacterium]|nr:winged helix-turn-helix transcriptional regulator [Dehalococcoidia bacterium]